MDKNTFMQAIRKAEELEISTFYFYASGAIKMLVLEDTPTGELRREKEVMHLRCAYTEAIMNSRDERICMQRELSKLVDIDIWEPENCTKAMYARMQVLREEIAKHRAKEAQYKNAKEALV